MGSLLQNHLGLEVDAKVVQARCLHVDKLQTEVHFFVQLLFLHGISSLAVSVPVLMVLFGDVQALKEAFGEFVSGHPCTNRKSFKRAVLEGVHSKRLSKQINLGLSNS